MQSAEIVVFGYLRFRFEYHVARVKSRVHIHRGNARLFTAVHKNFVYRGGAAVHRKQRTVNIDTAEPRIIENVCGKNFSVSDNDVQFGVYLRKQVRYRAVFERGRLINGNAEFSRSCADGRRGHRIPSAFRLIGL